MQFVQLNRMVLCASEPPECIVCTAYQANRHRMLENVSEQVELFGCIFFSYTKYDAVWPIDSTQYGQWLHSMQCKYTAIVLSPCGMSRNNRSVSLSFSITFSLFSFSQVFFPGLYSERARLSSFPRLAYAEFNTFGRKLDELHYDQYMWWNVEKTINSVHLIKESNMCKQLLCYFKCFTAHFFLLCVLRLSSVAYVACRRCRVSVALWLLLFDRWAEFSFIVYSHLTGAQQAWTV